MHIGRIDPQPLSFNDFIRPLFLVRKIPVLLAAIAYAMVFLFASVMNVVEIPQLLQEKFELNAQQLGLQFLGVIIGTLLGELMGGVISDLWMLWRGRHIGHRPAPEFRLWLSYIGFVLAMVGTIVFLVCTEQSRPGEWTVVPLVGTGIASFGNQVVTTVLITYSVDNHPEDAGSVGVFINFARLIWGFIGPFWYVILGNIYICVCVCLMMTDINLQVPNHVRNSWRCQKLRSCCCLGLRRQFYPNCSFALAGVALPGTHPFELEVLSILISLIYTSPD